MARNFLRQLGRDERGASVIEIGLFAPILGLMLMGVSDLAMGYQRKLQLEGAAYRALEKVAVGSFQPDYQTYIRADAAAAAGVPQGQVTVDSWLECAGTRQTSFTGSCFAGQSTTRYVSVSIDGSYRPRFSWGPLGRQRNSAGNVPVNATAALRIQ